MKSKRGILPSALCFGLLVLATALLHSPAAAQTGGVSSQDFSVDFGDFQSKAQLTYPTNAAGGSPTVILIHGSTAADMDFNYFTQGSTIPFSHIFKDIADYYPARGVAVLRYNKHYVSGPNQADQVKYAKADLNLFLSDAEKVLAAAESNPHVDKQHIYIYGWSEGSTVAAALVAKHPEVAGLIVQGPVAASWRETFKYQMFGVTLPYLLGFAQGGNITADTLSQALAGDGGAVARSEVIFLIDPSYFQTKKVAVSGFLDSNKDGVLTAAEVQANYDAILDFYFSPQGFFYIYSPDKALPTVAEQAANIKQPVLVLQGKLDANVPVTASQQLTSSFKGNADYSYKEYADLGHSLGPASSVIDDRFRPIATPPMADGVAWVLAHSNASANPPAAVSSTPQAEVSPPAATSDATATPTTAMAASTVTSVSSTPLAESNPTVVSTSPGLPRTGGGNGSTSLLVLVALALLLGFGLRLYTYRARRK